jgi:hypothetical protein
MFPGEDDILLFLGRNKNGALPYKDFLAGRMDATTGEFTNITVDTNVFCSGVVRCTQAHARMLGVGFGEFVLPPYQSVHGPAVKPCVMQNQRDGLPAVTFEVTQSVETRSCR